MPAAMATRRRTATNLTQAQRSANVERVARQSAEVTLAHLAVVNGLHGLLDDDAQFAELAAELGDILAEQLRTSEIRALVRAGR